MSRSTAGRHTCPRCHWNLLELTPSHNATSRRDNKTVICASCGTQEALEDSKLIKPWFDDPGATAYWDTNSPVWHAQSEKQHDKEQGLDKLKAEAEADLPMMLRNQAE